VSVWIEAYSQWLRGIGSLAASAITSALIIMLLGGVGAAMWFRHEMDIRVISRMSEYDHTGSSHSNKRLTWICMIAAIAWATTWTAIAGFHLAARWHLGLGLTKQSIMLAVVAIVAFGAVLTVAARAMASK
jgi:hypothetical protein